MAFVKKTWVNRAAQHLSRRILNIVSSTGTTMVADVSRGDTDVTEAGTPLNAENLNDLEDRIATATATMIGATEYQNGTEGVVPAPKISERLYFLRGDGTWQEASGGGGSYELPTASQDVKGGIKIGNGLRIYREVLSVPIMTAPTYDEDFGELDGYRGLVPDPTYSNRHNFLRADGTWTPIALDFDSGSIAVTAWSDGSSAWLDSTPSQSGETASTCYEYRIRNTSVTENDSFGITNWTANGWVSPVFVYCIDNYVVIQTASKPTAVTRLFGRIVH